ncbi:UDP-glucose:glycoprotein glucosyltransferase, putative [Phytophthora infestans T30-4]|uniref:UDP-glucose:glycoprotein glucosyltransferase, putative n=1 Tax=Phytophthora infestans (strain T30-4) TaxID=403677 RepID=D0N7I0_PHYIT|nr:UDP-glucose:glycoprotein glucosyltransferase, putative [Phytophthora infestans T30-4]EEY53529.1 UDP-glucose:glycoprotein glucosyltransferase, putative [Phytophthora infestans T30-4]|eukprot:XP_002905147.1 UDP-glucose:glycoprotein glucosyltransferase, putative [Phytophthora infestans T30-4]
MRPTTWLSAGLAALLTAAQPSLTSARGVHVNLTASWPSSPFFPLMETSEFLAEENPLYFWQFLEQLEARTSYVDLMNSDVDALGTLAVTVAESIAPGSKNVLELMLATRTYSVKVEMFRQLGLDSGIRPCGEGADTWAVFYKEKHCVESVACSEDELDAILRGKKQQTNDQACVAAGVNDVELQVDHKYPYIASDSENAPISAILYGLVGTEKFHAFHTKLVKQAQINKIQYMGYGVALDIKNMEYTTIDDSKKTDSDDTTSDETGSEEEDEEEEGEIDDEEVDGFLFKPLMARHGAIANDLKEFYDILVQKADGEQEQELKAWHLKDLGATAVRHIVDAKNPLKRLETLSQDFPVQAKKLAFSRKSISAKLREEIAVTRMQAANRRVRNKFIMNGIAVDPTERSFNVFDFMKTLKEEWSVAKQLDSLPLNQSELEDMLKHVRETNQEQPAVRIHVRGAMGGSTPLYLNNIETDPNSASWSPDVNILRRPAWNLIFVRKNMYECVLVMDPLSGAGRAALSHIGFMRMRGAPVQWALLISSKELMASNTAEERQAVVEKYKAFKTTDKASSWHFAKLLMLAQSKDTAEAAAKDETSKSSQGDDTEVKEEEERILPTRVASGFLQRVGEDEKSDVLVERLVEAYAEAAGGVGTTEDNEEEALECLKSDQFDSDILAMTEFIHLKHLPLDSFVFNGVVQKDLDIQRSMMASFGRDQPLYVNMAHRGLLTDDMDLVEELMTEQDAYPAYLSIFESSEARPGETEVKAPGHLVADDVDGRLEAASRPAVSYLHAPGSRTLPKKQTLIFPVDLNDPRDAGHAYRVVKAVLEDSEQSLRVGVVSQLKDVEKNSVGELAAAIIATIGHSDKEAHLKFVLEALNCIVKHKSINTMKDKLRGIWKKTANSESDTDPVYEKVLKLLNSKTGKWLTKKQRGVLTQFNTLLRSRFPPAYVESEEDVPKVALPHLFINGRQVTLPSQSLSDEDMATIVNFDLKYRTQPVAKALIKRSVTMNAKEADKLSFAIMKTTGIVDKYVKTDRTPHMTVDENSLNTVRLSGDPSLQVAAYVDPLSEAAQVMSSLLRMLHSQLNATIELVLVPADEYTEFPLQRFYRYLFDKKSSLGATSVEFRKLPVQPILTMKIDTPEAWNVQAFHAGDDLDNLRVDPDSPAAVKATTSAVFQLESLLVYGQCRDTTFNMYAPPNGLQLVLEREVGAQLLHRDTLVMKNLGYFQLQATPGVWSLHLARGRAAELFDIIDLETELPLETNPITVYDFGSHISQLYVRKKEGKEHEELLQSVEHAAPDKPKSEADETSSTKSYWDAMLKMMGKHDTKTQDTVEADQVDNDSAVVAQKQRTGETIHVFSVASGYLYERFVKIMMSSVLKRTNNPVTFWLLENFLSPDFKKSIPVLREQFGMDIRLVTYKWPNWLRQQTEKQRIIWGYKILFLDVLFPLGVQKIIYVDADQVVRADLKELWELDLDGKPYGYTPFCDSRNVGFQFWRQGYWKDHLRGKPYHISALYVVDLALFRQMAAGDMLRAVYSHLSADPNSLANLDQDLPNYAQHQIPIFSLPQEWLWCESWCSDETKVAAKTIDLCNNPKHKEPKLEMAKRVIAGELFNESWIELDQEIKEAEAEYADQA